MNHVDPGLAQTNALQVLQGRCSGHSLADGLLLATDGNTMVYLIEPSPTGFKPLASATLLEPGENWAPLALSGGKLLIRDHKNLKCLVVAQQGR